VTNRISGYKASDPLTTVKGSGSGAQAVDKTQGSAASASSAASSSASSSTADQVTLTGSAITLQKLGEAVANAPVVNTQKVATVKTSVQNGTYKVDAGRVADKMIQFESGLK
jgi:negative regulator of flagellin synthesis FlgM